MKEKKKQPQKPLPKAKGNKSLNSRPLTPSEIESLKKDIEEASTWMDEQLQDYK